MKRRDFVATLGAGAAAAPARRVSVYTSDQGFFLGDHGRNAAGDPAYAAVLEEMTAELRLRQAEAGDSDALAQEMLKKDLAEAGNK